MSQFEPARSQSALATQALFSPLKIRNLLLPNRVVMSPMTRQFSPGGVPGQNVADYYRRRAEGGVGLIITEGTGIDHPAAIGAGSMGEHNIPVLHGQAALEGWRNVVNAVHAAGGRIFPQLWHMGVIRQANTGYFPEAPSSGPSGVWGPEGRITSVSPQYLQSLGALPPPLTDSEILAVIEGYARSAANAREVGFDGIAIHGAHGYLIDTFLWGETNLRRDRWGGDLQRRTTFAVEVVKAMRRAVGADMPIMLRFSQWKLQDYHGRIANTPAELETILGPLADAGVDLFDASTRRYQEPAFADSPLTLAGWTKKLSDKPTMAVGGIGLVKDLPGTFENGSDVANNVPDVARRIEAGEFDLAAVGRSLLGDAHWLQKVRNGEPLQRFELKSFATLQ
jgi:2,4-dienoyl-CoA reductase-like NADH-dependent reductase (Old Yellow Enzyme family)